MALPQNNISIETPLGLEADLKAAQGDRSPQLPPLAIPKLPETGPRVPEANVMANIFNKAFSTKSKEDPFASKYQDASLSERYQGKNVYYGDYKLDNKILDPRYAATQSFQEKSLNNLQVGLANGGAMFVGSLLALPDMIRNIINRTSLADSQLNNSLYLWREQIANGNINFQNEQDLKTDAWNTIKNTVLPGFVSGASTGWGSIFENVMYGVGAGAGIAAQEALVSFIAPGIGNSAVLSANVAKIINNLDTIRKYGQLADRIVDTSQTLASAVRSLNQGNRLVDAAKWGYRATIGAYGEAGFEGEEARHNMRTTLTERFKQQNGYTPTGAELNKINKLADEAASARFWGNMALLMGSNTLQMGRLFRNIDLARDATERLAQQGLKIGMKNGKPVAESFELTSNWWTNGFGKHAKKTVEAVVPRVTGSFAMESLSEGAEEFTQNWIDKAVNNYYTWKLDHRGQSSLDSAVKSISDGFSESWSTEGLQAFLSGAIAGVAQQAAFSLPNAKKQLELNKTTKETLERVLGDYQNFDVADFFRAGNIDSVRGSLMSKTKDLNANGVADQVGNIAVENNDKKIYKDIESLSFYNLAKPYVLRGHTDILKQQFAYSLEEMSDEKVAELFDNPTLTRKKAIDAFNTRVDMINKSASEIKQAFRNPYTVAQENLYNIFEDDFIPELVYLNYRSKELSQRKQEIQSTLGDYYDEFKYFADTSDLKEGRRYIEQQIKLHEEALQYARGLGVKDIDVDETFEKNKYLLTAYTDSLTRLDDFEKSPSYESYNEFLDSYHEAFVSKLERDDVGFFRKEEVMSKLTDFNRILGDMDAIENSLRSYMKPNGQDFFLKQFENAARREQRKRDLLNLNRELSELKPELTEQFPDLTEEQIESIILDSSNVGQAKDRAAKAAKSAQEKAKKVTEIQDEIRGKFISAGKGDIAEDYISQLNINPDQKDVVLKNADSYLKAINNDEFKKHKEDAWNEFLNKIKKLNDSFDGFIGSSLENEIAYNTLDRKNKLLYHHNVIEYYNKLKSFPSLPKEFIKKQDEFIKEQEKIIKALPEEEEIYTSVLGNYTIVKKGKDVSVIYKGEVLEKFRTIAEAKDFISAELAKQQEATDVKSKDIHNIENKSENGYYDPETFDKDGNRIVDQSSAFNNKINKRELYQTFQGMSEDQVSDQISQNVVIDRYSLDGEEGTKQIFPSNDPNSGQLKEERILKSLTANAITIKYGDIPLQTYKDYQNGLGFVSPELMRKELKNKKLEPKEIEEVVKFIGDSNYYEFLQKSISNDKAYKLLQSKGVFKFKGTPQQQIELINKKQDIFNKLWNDSIENIKNDVIFSRVFTSIETENIGSHPIQDITYSFALLKRKSDGKEINQRVFFHVPNTFEPSKTSDPKIKFIDLPNDYHVDAKDKLKDAFITRATNGNTNIYNGYYMLLTDSSGTPSIYRLENKKLTAEEFYNNSNKASDFSKVMVLSDNPNIDFAFTIKEDKVRINVGDKTDDSVLSFDVDLNSVEDVEKLIPHIYSELGKNQHWKNVSSVKSLRIEDLGIWLALKTDGAPKNIDEIIETRNVTGINPLNYRVNKIIATLKNPAITNISLMPEEEITPEPKIKDVINDSLYDTFVENGTVPEEVLKSIASKIKTGQTLSPRETAIYQEFAKHIESLLVDKKVPPSGKSVDSASIAKSIGLRSPSTISYNQIDEFIGKMPNLQSTPEQMATAIILGAQVRAAIEQEQVYLNDLSEVDVERLDELAQQPIPAINNKFRKENYANLISKRIPYKTNVRDVDFENKLQQVLKNCFK